MGCGGTDRCDAMASSQPQESGDLIVEWTSRGASFVHTTLLYTRDTVAGLYGALRSFAESADYNPFRYERLTLGESVPLLVPGTTADDLADRLVRLDGFAAMTAIGRRRRYPASADARRGVLLRGRVLVWLQPARTAVAPDRGVACETRVRRDPMTRRILATGADPPRRPARAVSRSAAPSIVSNDRRNSTGWRYLSRPRRSRSAEVGDAESFPLNHQQLR